MGMNDVVVGLDADLAQLLALDGISGYEGAIAGWLQRQVPEAKVDAMGNVSVTLGGGDGPSLLLIAHQDEIGLVVSGVEEDGSIRFEKVGTIDDRLLAGRHVTIHTASGGVPGVIGAVPPHHGGSAGASPATLAIDVGAVSAAEVASWGIRVLDAATFDKQPRVMAGTRLNCRAIDDRVGCALALWAYRYAREHLRTGRVTVIWSVQEEVGLRGAQAIARRGERYDAIVPLDACASTDGPNHPRRLAYFPLGAGPVLRMIDHGSMASRTLAAFLQRLAAEAGVPLQAGVTGGETDGVPLQATGAHMVPLTIPMRYVHSLAESCDLRDVAAARRLLERLIDHLADLPRA
jgi:putative aminopeptidase FrvX